MVVGFFIYPISAHSFIMKASSKMFLARTQDATLFEKKQSLRHQERAEKQNKVLSKFGNFFQRQLSQNREIKISIWNSTKLFIVHNFCGNMFNCKNQKFDKYTKLYKKCQNKLENELEIVHILNLLKSTELLLAKDLKN